MVRFWMQFAGRADVGYEGRQRSGVILRRSVSVTITKEKVVIV